MRENTREVAEAWQAGQPCRGSESIWTDGESVYSYQTCIATDDPELGRILNRSSYSVTTSAHQNGLAEAIGRVRRDVEGLGLNVGPADLRERARESWRRPGVSYPREG